MAGSSSDTSRLIIPVVIFVEGSTPCDERRVRWNHSDYPIVDIQ